MAKYKLGDIAPIRQGIGPDEFPCWLLNLDMVESNTGRIIDYLYVQSDEIGASTVAFDTRNVLYSKLRPYLNKVVLPDRPGFATSEMLPLMPDTTIITREYLTHFLRSPRFVGYINEKTSGAKMPRANTTDLKAVEIDCPTIERQKAIVGVFECLTRIIELYQRQLCTLDTLIKARFVEMFGDPVVGDRIHGNRHKVGEFASVTKLAGFEFTKYIQYRESGDIIMLRGLNCKSGHLVLDDIKWIDQETSDLLPRSKLFYGDILMTYAGTIGEVAMVDADNKYHLAPNVGKITIEDKEHYDPVYLMYLFMFSHDYIMTFASQVAQASINMEKIRNFEYYFPSIDEQRSFAAFVSQVDKSKNVVQRVLERAQVMFDSLMQEYFG